MKPARESNGRPGAAADAADTAVAVDMAAAAKVASEEATEQHAQQPETSAVESAVSADFDRSTRSPVFPEQYTVAPREPMWRMRKIWAGLDSNQRRRKASRFTVCPVWPLRYLPFAVSGILATASLRMRALIVDPC